MKVTAVAGLAFPGVRQVVRIERHRREHGKAQGSREVVFAVTDLDAHQISPGELAAHARGHWTVLLKSSAAGLKKLIWSPC